MKDKCFKVRVPATSANMGPGFDSLGIAFQLFNEYIFTEIESGVEFIGFHSEFANKDNIIFKAMEKVFKDYNYDYSGVRIEIINCNIPVSRGLGSSSSCIIAGIIGAFSIMGKDINKSEVLKYAVEIEGHPDNVCPAIFGGLISTIMTNDKKPLYNCVNIERFDKIITEQEKKELKKKLGIPEQNRVILFTGRIVEEKGVRELLQAFQQESIPHMQVSRQSQREPEISQEVRQHSRRVQRLSAMEQLQYQQI